MAQIQSKFGKLPNFLCVRLHQEARSYLKQPLQMVRVESPVCSFALILKEILRSITVTLT